MFALRASVLLRTKTKVHVGHRSLVMLVVLLLLVLQLVGRWGVLLEGSGRRGLVERVVSVEGTVVRVGGSGREVDGMSIIVHEGPDGRQLVLAFC